MNRTDQDIDLFEGELAAAIEATGFNSEGLSRVFGMRIYTGVRAIADGRITRDQVHNAYWTLLDTQMKLHKEMGL